MEKANNPYNYSPATLRALERFGRDKSSDKSPENRSKPLPLPGTDQPTNAGLRSVKKTLEESLSDLEASKAQTAGFRDKHAQKLEAGKERSNAVNARLNALPQHERRQVLDAASMKHVSAAPKPITPLRGSNYSPPNKPPEPPPIDWRYWRHMPEVKQWEACALSMNINPDNMKPHPEGWMAGPGSGPLFTPASFPNATAQTEFDKRLRLLGASLFKSGFFTAVNKLVQGGRHLATISLHEFAVWALHVEFEDMPPELVAMAALRQVELSEQELKRAKELSAMRMPGATGSSQWTPVDLPEAVREPQAAPVEADSASGGVESVSTNWKMQVQAEAASRFNRLRASGASPTPHSILDDMATWCRANDVKTDGGIYPSAGYLRTHVLGGKHWTPPR